MRFACFGGAAAVADEAVAVARHRRGKFFFGKGNKGDKSLSRSKASSPRTKRTTSPGRRDTDFDIYDTIAAPGGKLSSSSSVQSLSALSTASSLDSAYSSSSSLSCSSSRSSSSSSSSLLEAAPPQPAKRRPQPDEQRRSPAAGAAAVLVCLVMLTFGGRFAATLLTAAVLCFFPRQWPAYRPTVTKRLLVDGVPSSPVPVVASRRGTGMINMKAVTDGFLARNRKK